MVPLEASFRELRVAADIDVTPIGTRSSLGGWSKDITRQHAERLGLIVAEKPDSQDICFVPNGSYAKVVEKFRPGT